MKVKYPKKKKKCPKKVKCPKKMSCPELGATNNRVPALPSSKFPDAKK